MEKEICMHISDLGFVRLRCHYNKYAWGKVGRNSEVANLFEAGHPDFQVDPNENYSELWMGTHPDGAARVWPLNERLSHFIAKTQSEGNLAESNNNHLEKKARTEVHLPFIMKVMSIDRTLSLQTHPNKKQAERLHSLSPQNYPDRNHKPELAYALTRFELLCGFRPANDMVTNIKAFEPLRELFGAEWKMLVEELAKHPKDPTHLECRKRLAAVFRHMLLTEEETLRVLIRELMDCLDNGVRGAISEDTVRVIRKMAIDFPGDVGIFSPLFLNHMILEPGECCYYASEELHAYLSGECVECVGCSNNTIRAAMTPKHIDRENLCEVLNYRMTHPDDYLVPACTLPDYPFVDEYAPDCKDFQLHRVRIPIGARDARIPALDCGSIIVIHSGRAILEEEAETSHRAHSTGDLASMNGYEVKRGDIFYIRPGRRLRFAQCSESLEAFRTFSFEEGPDHENRNVVGKRHLNGVDFDVFETGNSMRPRDGLDSSRESGIYEAFEVECEMDGFI